MPDLDVPVLREAVSVISRLQYLDFSQRYVLSGPCLGRVSVVVCLPDRYTGKKINRWNLVASVTDTSVFHAGTGVESDRGCAGETEVVRS